MQIRESWKDKSILFSPFNISSLTLAKTSCATVSESSQWQTKSALIKCTNLVARHIVASPEHEPAALSQILVDLRQYYVFAERDQTDNLTTRISQPTHNPFGCISNILTLTLSPISFIQDFTRSRSFVSGHTDELNVVDSNFFI